MLIGAALAAALGGCGGISAPTPATDGISVRQSGAIPAAKGETLLYASLLGENAVDVYTYPAGEFVQALHDFSSVAGLCSNKSGDVFVVDESGPVDVYSHGGSAPIRRLTTAGAPYGCAVDPVTGNLAVTNLSSHLDGTISIYAKANGKPKSYFNKTVGSTYFCAYDDKGNLFIDGWSRSDEFIVLELRKGKQTFAILHPVKSVSSPGGVQWDGKYVAFGDNGGGLVYRMTEIGDVKQTVTLYDGTDIEGFWLDGSTLIGPNAQSNGTIGFWHYPAGGTPTKTLAGFSYPIGATLSSAQ